MESKKRNFDWELTCPNCKKKYFKIRGKTKGSVRAKCKNCGKVANVKTLKVR